MANASQLSADQLTSYNALGTTAKSFVNLDYAVTGPAIIQHPEDRVMTGAISATHATEQRAALSGKDPTKLRSEAGTTLSSHKH